MMDCVIDAMASPALGRSRIMASGQKKTLGEQIFFTGPAQIISLRHFPGRPKIRKALAEASWQELAGVLVFSATPFVVVKAIANSTVGEALQRRLKVRKEEDERQAAAAKCAQEKAKQESMWYGPDRPKWLGPLDYAYPQHLGVDMAGDYGFDPLFLAAEKSAFDRYYNLEIIHARWAMLGIPGVFIPELLVRYGGVQLSEPVWWKVGYAKLQGDTLDYLGVPGLHVAGAQGVLIIAISQFLLMYGPEYARYCGIEALEPLGIYLPGDINYPGGVLFDPLGLSSSPEAFQDLKVKEMKHGRLAMVAWLGFFAQAALTRDSPVDNLLMFLQDPVHNNVRAFL